MPMVNRKVQRKAAVLNASGEATWTFDPPFDVKPVVSGMCEESAEAQPVALKVKGFAQSGGKYMSVTVKGYRARALPALTNNLNALATALSNFNIFGGSAPSGLAVHLIAGEPTG
jgi:hypothetical protein